MTTKTPEMTIALSRRAALKTAAAAGGAVWLAACGTAAESPQGVSPATVTVDLALLENQPLLQTGGTLALGPNSLDSKGLLLVRRSETEVLAFSRSCTHLGCAIDAYAEGRAHCPCHRSAFDLTGRAVNGPASQPLKAYAAAVNGQQVEITNA